MNTENSNLQINYLKEKYLSISRLNYIFSDPLKESEIHIANFIEKIAPHREKIANSQTIEDLKFEMQEIETIRENTWGKVWQQPGSSYDFIVNYYYISGANSRQNWIDEQIKMYDNKKFVDFFEKTSNSIKKFFQFNVPEYKKEEAEALNVDTIKLGREVINKFNLTYIDLSCYSTNEECTKFLNKLDENASIAFEKLGVLPEVFGIHQTFSVAGNTTNQGWCSSVPKQMNFDINLMSSSTILHEWIHGLDNYVCENATNINSYVSSREDVFFEDETFPITQAYKELRNLTQSLFNDNPEAIKILKDKIVKDNSAKFYSIILGNDWYTMEEDKRNYLLNEKSIKKINNFMSMNLDSQGYEHVAKDLVANIKSLGVDINETTLVDKRSEIETDIKPYFESVNKNFIHGKSRYYIECLLSDKTFAVPYIFINSKISSVKKWLGIEDRSTKTAFDKNYFSSSIEMLARYFEGQVFPEVAKIYNSHCLTPIYKISKDKNFESYRDKIITPVFGEGTVIENISKMRTFKNTTDNKMRF